MTLYAVFAYEDEGVWEHLTPPERDEAERAYADYTRMLKAGDHNRGWQVLQPTASGATLRVRDGKTMTTDGPFMETKEALGGFYLIAAADLDEAITLAVQCPSAVAGFVHVRPVRYSSDDLAPDT